MFAVRVERPAPAPPETALREPDRVVLEEIPAQPESVRLDYPDGSHMHAGWQYSGPADTGHEQYIVRVPASARVVNGMVIRTSRDVVFSVAVTDFPLRLRTLGGGTTDAL